MTWQTDDGEHEGATPALFADGALAGSYGPAGVEVSEYADGTRAEHQADVRADAEVIGWRAWCSCGWKGSTYTRVASPELEDRVRRLAYEAADSPFPPQWVEDTVHGEWLAHVAPAEAVTEVAAAAHDVAAATERLDDAAIRARLAGASWAAIGAAAGITRQAAHLRWYNRTLPVLVADLDAEEGPILEVHTLEDFGPEVRAELARGFAPGTRVLRTDNGRRGTVAPDAITAAMRGEHPDMVPVQYDHDDASLTSPHVLVELRDEPEAQR